MPRQRDQAAPPTGSRRERILREAARMFAAKGFHGVSVDDIGEAAGISGPAVYRHFASKDSMLAEMLVGISEDLLAGGTVRATGAADAGIALGELVDFHITFALDHPELITVQDRDLASLPEVDQRRVRRLQRAYLEAWVDVLGQTGAAVSERDARAAVHAVFGLLNSTPHAAVTDRAAMSGLLRRMALAALRAT